MLKDCPFCGKPVNENDPDALYRSGIYWADGPLGRSYIGHQDRHLADGACYKIVCRSAFGGCGGSISADSKEEAIAAWNRRST